MIYQLLWGGVEEATGELGNTSNLWKGDYNMGTLPLNAMTSTEETPNTLVKVAPGRNLRKQGLNQIEPSRRIQRPREASREDAIAPARQFFASVNEQSQVTTSELPIETPACTSEGNTMSLNIHNTFSHPYSY